LSRGFEPGERNMTTASQVGRKSKASRASAPSGVSLLQLATDLHENARRASETALAATLTIAKRQEMIVAAMSDPRRLAHPEFTRMVTEKLRASSEATLAALTGAQQPVKDLDRWVQTQGEIAMLAWQEMARATTPLGAIDLWTSMTRRSVEASLVLAEAMAGIGASLFRAGLDPFHRAVTANARRLHRS
jgi:hypothetical protein